MAISNLPDKELKVMAIKIDKPVSTLPKKKRERTQIIKIRNERGEIATDITEI